MIKASAPGKIILFGEHAVVYGQPALAVPVNQVHADAEILDISRTGIWIDAPDIGLYEELSRLAPDDPLAAVVKSVISAIGMDVVAQTQNFIKKKHPVSERSGAQPKSEFPVPRPSTTGSSPVTLRSGTEILGIQITITSTIPLASGMGSGAAVSVAVIRALSAHFGSPLSDEKISELAYEVEKIHHGTPSGIDNTVVTYGKPVFFTPSPSPSGSGEPSIEPLHVVKPFTILIGDTGLPAPTKESVGDVRKLWEQNPKKMEALFAAAGSIARTARQAIEGGHPERLGPLMNENHLLLQEMTVSSPELDRLTEASLRSEAFGAKLSGGGRGGNMIALSAKGNAPVIAEALLEAGAKNVIITQVE